MRALPLLLALMIPLLVACPSDDDDDSSATDDDDDSGAVDDDDDSWVGDGVATFSAIGDVPYTGGQADWLEGHVENHNVVDLAPWMIHLGDIKPSAVPCTDEVYADVEGILRELDRPVFIIPGDNEWNDCADPDEAWGFWTDHFARFEENWDNLPSGIVHQDVRDENFAFVRDGVLFVGINLVGGAVHDADEWATRFEQNMTWWQAQIDEHGDAVGAAVLLGHAMLQPSTTAFFDDFAASAGAFGKPVLYLHGDGHVWIEDNPFGDAPNVLRVQVEANASPPLRVTVDPNAALVFTFERDPFAE